MEKWWRSGSVRRARKYRVPGVSGDMPGSTGRTQSRNRMVYLMQFQAMARMRNGSFSRKRRVDLVSGFISKVFLEGQEPAVFVYFLIYISQDACLRFQVGRLVPV